MLASDPLAREVAAAYRRIFSRLGVPFTVVEGDGGSMGGVSSHEIHFPAGIGQDTLLLCTGAGPLPGG